MTDWYYHQPGQGRVGPLDADAMRKAYRERRISRETLAWHEGLREWQPFEKMIEELGLTGVQPDASLPPPVPPRPAAATASHAGPMRGTAPPPSNRIGCIIAVVVIGVVGLVLVAILAAIALPSYRDYVERSKAAAGQKAQQPIQPYDAERMARTDALARELVTAAMREFYVANGNTCPDTFEFETLQVRNSRYQGSEDDGWFVIDPARPQSGVCAYEIGFRGLGAEVEGKRVQYDVNIAGEGMAGEDVVIYCRNRDIPAGYAPSRCGA
jgi:type IV pilus assembly protein PilA